MLSSASASVVQVRERERERERERKDRSWSLITRYFLSPPLIPPASFSLSSGKSCAACRALCQGFSMNSSSSPQKAKKKKNALAHAVFQCGRKGTERRDSISLSKACDVTILLTDQMLVEKERGENQFNHSSRMRGRRRETADACCSFRCSGDDLASRLSFLRLSRLVKFRASLFWNGAIFLHYLLPDSENEAKKRERERESERIEGRKEERGPKIVMTREKTGTVD